MVKLDKQKQKQKNTYTHTKLKQTADYRRVTWQTKESKNEINQLKTKLKYKPESRTKAECQLRNKANKKKKRQKW